MKATLAAQDNYASTIIRSVVPRSTHQFSDLLAFRIRAVAFAPSSINLGSVLINFRHFSLIKWLETYKCLSRLNDDNLSISIHGGTVH